MMLETDARQMHCPLIDRMCLTRTCMAWHHARPLKPKRYMVTFRDKPEEEWVWNPEGAVGYEGVKVRVLEDKKDYGTCAMMQRG